MNKNELYHSSVYLGLDYTDGIRHWKYIKKERVNGKWRYYYSDAEYNQMKKEYELAAKNYKQSEKNLFSVNDKNISVHNSKNSTLEAKNRADIALQKAYKKYEAAGKRYMLAEKKWKKVKMKTAPRRVVAKGASAVANALTKLKKKITTKINKYKK